MKPLHARLGALWRRAGARGGWGRLAKLVPVLLLLAATGGARLTPEATPACASFPPDSAYACSVQPLYPAQQRHLRRHAAVRLKLRLARPAAPARPQYQHPIRSERGSLPSGTVGEHYHEQLTYAEAGEHVLLHSLVKPMGLSLTPADRSR